MKKNTKGGKKFKRGKKNTSEKINMVFAEDSGEEYAKVIKLLGNGRIQVILKDRTEKLCIIPGRFKKKKIRVTIGSVILIAIRDYQPDKADVLFLYNDSQLEILLKSEYIPNFFKLNIHTMDLDKDIQELENNIVFQDNSDSEEEQTINIESKSTINQKHSYDLIIGSEYEKDDGINLEDI